MSDITQVQAQLEKTSMELSIYTRICHASSQYKAMIDAENKYNQLTKQLAELQELEWQNKCDTNKQELIALGFELRTNFEVISQDYYKRMYKYVIVHENAPQFTSLSINNGVPNIEVLFIHYDAEWIWEQAYEKWSKLTIDEQNELIR